MLRELVTNLQPMPQFAGFLLWKINNQRSRGSTIASFASSTDTGVGEICLSLYHWWIQQPRPGQKFKVSVERATIYTQAQKGRLRWIVIGSPAVWDLQTVYLHIVHPKVPCLSPFIIFIATNGWQITLDLMEDDLTTVCIPYLNVKLEPDP